MRFLLQQMLLRNTSRATVLLLLLLLLVVLLGLVKEFRLALQQWRYSCSSSNATNQNRRR